MKKLLIGLLIALAVMVMLVFALNACDSVPTAKALDVSTVLPDGVVRPSECLDVDFRDTTTVDSHLGQLHNYVLSQSTYSIVHGVAPSCNGASYSIYLQKNTSVYIPFVPSSVGYYHFTFICHGDGINTASLGIYGFALDTLVTFANNVGASATSTRYTYSLNVSDLSLNTYSYFQVFHNNSSSAAGVYIDFVKVEYTPSVVQFQSGKFTGFVIPDFTFDPNGDVSPYDSWDGIVMPNLLNGADLFEYPYYYPEDPEVPSIASHPRDVYYSDAPTSCFHTEYSLTGLLNLPVCVIYDNRNTSDLLANVVTLNYRYSYQDLFPDMLPFYNLTYTLCASGFNYCHITMETNTYHSVNLTINGLDALGFGQPCSLTLFDGAPDAFNYVDITVTFTSVAARDLSVYFYYSKLEAGDLFTGFVPLDHCDLTVVSYDLLPNYDFSSAPIHRIVDGEFDIRANDVNWFITGLQYQNFTISFPAQGGLRVQCPSEYGYSLIYDFVPDEVGIANYMNFALKAFTNVAFTVEVYHYDDRDNTSNLAPIKSCYFLRSSTTHDISFSFPFASDGVRIIIGIDGISDTTFYYSKLEYGDVFTGYCENSDIMYNRAYDAGYTDGSVDAIDQFSSSTYDWTFGQEGQWLRLDVGWSDLGFSSGVDLNSAYFTLFPAFYTANGIPIASTGYFTESSNNAYVVTVYASRYDVSNLELLDEYLNIFIVKIYEDYSTLLAKDESFTPDYLVYDRNRTVSLNVTRGLDNLTDFYNNAIYNDGYQTGYVDGEDFGYVQGRARGYSEAVKYYQEIGSTGGWFGFISAFIDVPISVITNLLDWDFFGFNLLNIIKVLILFSLTFLVLRLITKGRAQV